MKRGQSLRLDGMISGRKITHGIRRSASTPLRRQRTVKLGDSDMLKNKTSSMESKRKASIKKSSAKLLEQNQPFKLVNIEKKQRVSGVKERSRKRTKRLISEMITTKTRRPSPQKKDQEKRKEIIYERATYLAVRNESDGFYICQALQHVYSTTERFRILWLDKVDGSDSEYSKEYVDEAEPDTILTDVKMTRKEKNLVLPAKQMIRIESALNNSIKGHFSEDDDSDSDEPVSKSRKVTKTTKHKSTKKISKGVKSKVKKVLSSKVKKQNKKNVAKKENKKKEIQKKKRLTAEERKNPNLLLKPNKNIKVLKDDPFLNSNDRLPFISTSVQNKLLMRAVLRNDMGLLKSLISDRQHVSNIMQQHSIGYKRDAIKLALMLDNVGAINLLMEELHPKPGKKPSKRAPDTPSLIQRMGTGSYNPSSLGIPAIRQLTMSRGSREGNNALLKDAGNVYYFNVNKAAVFALGVGVKKSTLDAMYKIVNRTTSFTDREHVYNNIVNAVRYGHRKLAAELMEEASKVCMQDPFNFLHRDVLRFDGSEDLKPFRDVSAQKKPWTNYGMTPIHCAAINPNTKYLSKLLTVLPEYNILDKSNRRPVHYAAACSGTGPLEFLLKRGVDPEETDSSGFTALMIACQAGRAHNVEVLLKKAFHDAKLSDSKDAGGCNISDDDDNDENAAKDAATNKYGVGGINRPMARPNKYHSLCPIHLAIEHNNLDCLNVLIKYGVDVNKTVSAGKDKKTPIMMAAAVGDLDIVKVLYNHGAIVEQKDKHKMTALMHSIMNGHAHVASYLMSLGADANAADSSGNTCMHYAAAYGWYFIVKLLIDAGIEANVKNDWMVTPMWIAFLKGHMGLVDFFLQRTSADINSQDDKGMTLLAIACGSPLEDGLVNQIEYLVKNRGADVKICDKQGNTPLHHLANNSIRDNNRWNPHDIPGYIAESVKIAKVLIDHGCDVSKSNDERMLPINMAVMQANGPLIKLLAEHSNGLPTGIDKNRENILHILAKNCMKGNQKVIIDSLWGIAKNNHKQSVLYEMANACNKAGYTPLLISCRTYMSWDGKVAQDDSASDDSEHDEDDEDEEDENEDDEDNDSGNDGSEEDDEEDDFNKKKKTAKTSRGLQDVSEKQSLTLKNAREFISALITICKSDINAKVEQKLYDRFDVIPKEERKKFVHENEGHYYPLHYLVDTSLADRAPFPLLDGKGNLIDPHPALTLLLKHKPAIDPTNFDGFPPLLVAMESNHKDFKLAAIKTLVEHGSPINAPYHDKRDGGWKCTPLLLSVQQKCAPAESCCYLLSKGASSKILFDTKTGNSPLHIAVSAERSEALPMVEALLSKGADINAINNKKQTPLHLAVNSNEGGSDTSSELEGVLLAAGADFNARDIYDRIPLHYIFAKENRMFDSSPIDPIELCSTLTEAMEKSNVDVLDKWKCAPIHYAALRDSGVCLMNLIQHGAKINLKNGFGNTPIANAALSGHESSCILLLQRNANINVPVHYISAEQRKAIQKEESEDDDADEDDEDFKLILKDKPNWMWSKLRDKQQAQIYPLFQVCVKNNWQGVVYMLLDIANEKGGMRYVEMVAAAVRTRRFNLALTLIRKQTDKVKLQSLLDHSQNLLHLLALKAGPQDDGNLIIRIASLLVKASVKVNDQDDYGSLPLHYAAVRCNTQLAKFLIDNSSKSDLLAKDKRQRTPLNSAFYVFQYKRDSESFDELFKYLLSIGSKMNDQGSYFPTPDYEMFGHQPSCVASLDKIEEDYLSTAKGLTKMSCVAYAVSLQDFQLVKLLIDQGAKIDCKDENGMTPIMHAMHTNNVHLVKLLFDHKYVIPEKIEEDNNDEESEDEDSGSDYSDSESFKQKKTPLKKKLSRRRFNMGLDSEDDYEPKKKKRKMANDVFANFTSFHKVSNINVNAQDDLGRSVLHHLIESLPYGTYDNLEILKLLKDAGAVLSTNKAGEHVLTTAQRVSARNLLAGLQQMMKSSKKVDHIYKSWPDQDGINHKPSTVPHYKDDAKEFLKKYDAEHKEVTAMKPEDSSVKFHEALLSQYPNSKEALSLVKDENQSIPYDTLLTKIDVGKLHWSLYNFYKMQVVYEKNKDIYILFNNWGRIGDQGQHQVTPYQTKSEAVKEFCKVFRSKTGNHWNDVKSFQQMPKKYQLMTQEERKKEIRLSDIDFDLKTSVKSSLSPYVHDLMQDLCNVESLKCATDAASSHPNSPFGRIDMDKVLKAKDILCKIAPLTKAINDRGTSNEKLEDMADKILHLSNEYYHLIPQYGFESERLTPLNDTDTLETQFKLVENMLELQIAGRMLAGAQLKKHEMNPLDYIYACTECKIEVLQENDLESQLLLKYISNSKHNHKVKAIFRVQRPSEIDRFRNIMVHNHKLLFHGTKTFNMLSLLTRGLLVSPAEAPITGRSLGNGVYFADAFAKSAMYCKNFNKKSNEKFVLVCQVAVGKPKLVKNNWNVEPDNRYDSIMASGNISPNPALDLTLPSGATIPLGICEDSNTYNIFQYNEYVIDKEEHISLRYIIQFE